jgi:serine/alanine adding enzyme
MNRNGRYNLRYAEKTPVVIKVGQDEKDLKKIYQLSTITRRRINLLPQPYNLYRSIYNNIIVPGHGYMLLAELNGKIIAANVYFCFNRMVLHEFAVQDSDYMEYRPNYLLIWKAIERAKNEGYLYYNFGRTQPENQSLIQFKKNWGSNEAVLPYYYYPDIRGLSTISKSSRIYQTYNTMNKCLPPFLLKVVCEFMQKHMN